MTIDKATSAFTQWLATAPRVSSDRESRLSFLDTIGCLIAGAGADVVAKARAADGAPAVTYGSAAHAHGFDDSEFVGSTHPSAVIIAALLGLEHHQPIRFDTALDAYCAGFATIQFLGTSLGYAHYQKGWHATATIGAIGAAAACARAMGLAPSQFGLALSLAASQSAGLKAQFGSEAKPLQAGFAAQAGLQAALLARAGITASPCIWSAFIDLYGGDRTTIADLPATLDIPTGAISRKPWPCCQYTHRAIEAALSLGVAPAEVKAVTISGPAAFLDVVSVTNPSTPGEARFSLQWCIACAISDEEVTLNSFTHVALARADIRALADRISVGAVPVPGQIEDLSPAHPDTVLVTTTDGARVKTACANVSGGAAHPMTRTQQLEKFNTCCDFTSRGGIDGAAVFDSPPGAALKEIPGIADFFPTE